jgi:hypothetical protein
MGPFRFVCVATIVDVAAVPSTAKGAKQRQGNALRAAIKNPGLNSA